MRSIELTSYPWLFTFQRKYINLRPYHDVNETRMSGGYDLQEFPRRELNEVGEGGSQDSGVFDTFF